MARRAGGIALIIFIQSTVFLPTPSVGAGAVEYLVAGLARGLHRLGHEVWLFGLEGSQEGVGYNVVTVPANGSVEARELTLAGAMAGLPNRNITITRTPDVIFDHSMTFQAQRLLDVPAVSMSHGMAPIPGWARNVVFTTEHHGRLHGRSDPRALYPGLDMTDVPPLHGLVGDYLLWAGRLMAYKQPWLAVEIAKKTKMPLLFIAAAGDEHVRRRCADLFTTMPVGSVWLNDVPRSEVLSMMRDARAVLFTSDSTEPAGLVMLEAQAVGTPVIAFSDTAAPELVSKEGGFVIDNYQGMIDAVRKIQNGWGFKPAAARAHVEQHFTMDTMAEAAEDLLSAAVRGDRW